MQSLQEKISLSPDVICGCQFYLAVPSDKFNNLPYQQAPKHEDLSDAGAYDELLRFGVDLDRMSEHGLASNS
jgi:hypothetical protein